MSFIFGLLSFIIFIAIIVGLVKPNLILKWDKKPTRLKVLGYGVLSIVAVSFLGTLFISQEDIAQEKINTAEKYIEDGKFESAIVSLGMIKEENQLYSEAQSLIQRADSLKLINEEKERIAKEEAEAIKVEENKGKLKEQLERELKSFKEGINFSQYRGSVESIQLELVLFGVWANTVSQGEASDDKATIALAKKLKAKIARTQEKEFPKLRKDYAKTVAKKMWENDIEVSSSGSKHNRINFTGGIFAANKNKQEFQNQLDEILTMLRFSQSRYRWYKGQDEYTYYQMKPSKDRELVTFDK